jgi:hypothetical protein
MKLWLMSTPFSGDINWLWIDIRAFKYWYVFIWRRWKLPFMYRSLDATPPDCGEYYKDGKMIFGTYK